MKLSVFILSVVLSGLASAQTKIALVRVRDIYLDLPSTKLLQDKLLAQREAIEENERRKQLLKSLAELDQLNKEIESKLNLLNSEEGQKLVKAFELKRQETKTLQTEFVKFKANEEKRINTEMVAATRASLNKITQAAQQLAKERNFDVMFDSSAETNTGLKLLLYTNNTNDLTEDVITLLGEKAPEPEPTPENKQ